MWLLRAYLPVARGTYCLVKVSEPDRQADHFEQLKEDFLSKDIQLDTSKGANANDARFFSYDPAPYIADTVTIYDRLPAKKPVRPQVVKKSITDVSRYGERAFESEIANLASTAEGNRNNQLFKSAASLAELVAGKVLTEEAVREGLHATAHSIGLPEGDRKSVV